MNAEIRQRLKWVKLYEELGDAGVVCRRCGISRPTLRKWVKRYQQEGESGLNSMSRRPHHSPKRYSLLIPGERVQMDSMKVAPGMYQYTAVDDCSRFRVLAVYPRRDARYTLLFLERVIEEMPFLFNEFKLIVEQSFSLKACRNI